MRFRHHDSLRKSLAFAVIHLLIAVSVGYALTGSFVLAGVLSLVEPAVNTVVHYQLERRWGGRSLLGKTLVFGGLHLAVSIGVGYALTGSFVLAGLYAFIEPALNTVAHHVFERWWAAGGKAAVPVGGGARVAATGGAR
jgi:uncharacterized membrane protein